MKYILSQDEYDNLIDKNEIVVRDRALETARQIILSLVDNEYIKCKGRSYCTECPISIVGDESDTGWEDSLLICREYREYPK